MNQDKIKSCHDGESVDMIEVLLVSNNVCLLNYFEYNRSRCEVTQPNVLLFNRGIDNNF